MSKPICFADFQPGITLGERVETYGTNMAHAWQSIFGQNQDDGSAEAASVAVVLSMRAFLGVVAPRPPGNVHAREQFTLASLPRLGEEVRTVVSCTAKEIKRERFYVDLEVNGTGDGGRVLFTGRMSLIWAA
ncbi:MAG: hypothetical protein Q7K57_03040 [Burkholderiaceae bacterium]|nr:hypothetical protein [Burkholderiaceae bacterium]